MEYGVFSSLLLKIKENPSHNISEGRGAVASHHHSLSIREQRRRGPFILEIPWSVYQKERGAEDEVMGRGSLGQHSENSDLWNSLFSNKNPHTGAKHERDLESPK